MFDHAEYSLESPVMVFEMQMNGNHSSSVDVSPANTWTSSDSPPTVPSDDESLVPAVTKKRRNKRNFDARNRDDENLHHPGPSNGQLQLYTPPVLVENVMDRLIMNLKHLELACDKLRISKHAPFPADGYTVDNVILGESLLGMELGAMGGWPKTPCVPPPGFLPIEEHIRLRKPFPPKPYDPFEKVEGNKLWLLADSIYSVECLKTFEFFPLLYSKDKRILSRHVALLVANLTAAYYSYENKSDITYYPDGTCVYGGKLPDSDYERTVHKKLIGLLIELNLDREEYVLMKAMIICDPAIDDMSTSARKMLAQYRERYAKTLLSYVIAKRGVAQGPSFFVSILSLMETLGQITQKQKNMMLLINSLNISEYHRASCKCEFVSDIMNS